MTSGNGRQGSLRTGDIEVLARFFGFDNAANFISFAEEQQSKMENRQLAEQLNKEFGFREMAIAKQLGVK